MRGAHINSRRLRVEAAAAHSSQDRLADVPEATTMTQDRLVYRFGVDELRTQEPKVLLGGKGAGLWEMSRLGLPVPPGFTITTEACRLFMQRGSAPGNLAEEVMKA